MLTLDPDQREAVALLLEGERIGAIHDVLANLPAWNVPLDGAPLDDLAQEAVHWDFMARIEGGESG